MKGSKRLFKTALIGSLLFVIYCGSAHSETPPVPFDRMKEIAIAQGQKNGEGFFVWEKTVEDIEYWMVYSPSDESIGCGQRTTSGSHGWGIAYGLKGDYQFVEARMGQVVYLLILEEESALEIANQFFKQVEPLIENLKDMPAEGKWTRI